jgi:hypothetical protein
MILRYVTTPFALSMTLMLVNTSLADRQDPGVSLILSKVSADVRGQESVFRCEVILDNDTEKRLTVISNFHSAFDGLDLVVTNIHGKVLAQQPYTFHQSPFTRNGTKYFLKRGETKTTLVFPLNSFGVVGQAIKVRLVGRLPGSSYPRILSTDTMQIVISKRGK